MEQAALNKKKSEMEVRGAGLQVWEPKVTGRDGGSEHIAGPGEAAHPWTLLPPLYSGDCEWQTLASVCPRLLCTSSSPHCGLHRALWQGGMGEYPWHNLVGGVLQLKQWHRGYPQPQPGHSRKGPHSTSPPACAAPTFSPRTGCLLLRVPTPHLGW